jgi:hypothetical protein
MNAPLRFGAQLAALAVLAVTLSGPALAPVTTGTLYGRVVDRFEAVIPEAKVTATNVLDGTATTTVANARGDFTLHFLDVGTYTVTIEAPFFQTRVEKGVEISSGREITMTYPLELGVQDELVLVTTEAPMVNLASAE